MLGLDMYLAQLSKMSVGWETSPASGPGAGRAHNPSVRRALSKRSTWAWQEVTGTENELVLPLSISTSTPQWLVQVFLYLQT